MFPNRTHHEIMVYIVKEASDVQIYNPVVAPASHLSHTYSLKR
jgi:hypothetical protein